MKKIFFSLLVFSLSYTSTFAFSNNELEKAKENMISESISSYSGNCPCPYNSMRNGKKCGKRSAYSRPGGASPLCFKNDISAEEALLYLKRRKLEN